MYSEGHCHLRPIFITMSYVHISAFALCHVGGLLYFKICFFVCSVTLPPLIFHGNRHLFVHLVPIDPLMPN